MILPSKKVLSVFILTAALVVAVIVAFGRDKSSEAINFASNLVAGEKVSVPENPNWQNELSQVKTNAEPAQIESNTSTPETATDTISKTLMSNYLALKQSGTLDAASAQKLVDQTANFVNQLGSNVVLDTKLNIIPDNGKQTITDYGENLGSILRNNKPAYEESEMDIVKKALETKDLKKLEELGQIINTFTEISKEMKAMPVPKTFVKAHLDMVNGIDMVVFGLNEVKFVFSDSFRGMGGIQIYGQGITLFLQSFKATLDFIKQNNTAYKQGSGGYYLLYRI
ncbi:MAG: hypothetical protein AAB837_00550 [Patescibacteria group bacterium]